MKSKICGISDIETLKFLTNHPASPQFIGFIVNYPKSKRYGVWSTKTKYDEPSLSGLGFGVPVPKT